ncbi:MAG: hypothetical protein A2161_19955, partial [Candidatus Schekmanbacteria bacterium RBG_13_48_7]
MKRFIDKGKTQKLIIDKGRKQKLIDQKIIIKTLGVEDTGIKIKTKQNPITLFALRQLILDRLFSTGGRPKLEGASKKRDKISFLNQDRQKLEAIAEYYEKIE